MEFPSLDIQNLTGQCSLQSTLFQPVLSREAELADLQRCLKTCDSMKTNISFDVGTMTNRFLFLLSGVIT